MKPGTSQDLTGNRDPYSSQIAVAATKTSAMMTPDCNSKHNPVSKQFETDMDNMMRKRCLEKIVEGYTAKPPRKRVRFDADSSTTEGQVDVRVVETLRPSSAMTEEEKEKAWYQKQYFQENIQNARSFATTLAYRCSVDSKVKDYTEALASTYASCTVDDWQGLCISDHCAQHLALLTNVEHTAASGECARGLEKVAVPFVGQEAVRRRNDAIGSVLLAQYALGQGITSSERQEVLRRISEEQSKCARKFAKAMGTADAISALMAYDVQSPNLTDQSTVKQTKDPETGYDLSFSLLSLPVSQNSMAMPF